MNGHRGRWDGLARMLAAEGLEGEWSGVVVGDMNGARSKCMCRRVRQRRAAGGGRLSTCAEARGEVQRAA